MPYSTLHDLVPAGLRSEARLLPAPAPEWADALHRCEHDIYHVPELVVLESALTGDEPAAFWYAEGDRVFLLPLSIRSVPDSPYRDAISPYGYPGPISNADPADTGFWQRAGAALVDTMRANGVVTVFVRLNPLIPVALAALRDTGTVVFHGETVSVDLTLSPEEMWRETRSDHRNHINRARRAEVRVVWDDWDRLDEWVAVYHANMRRLGADDSYFVPAPHFRELRAALGDRMHLAVAVHDGEVVGGNTFFEYRGYVQAYLASTRRENSHHADKLLYDEVRKWTAARGNRIFHVGGGVGGAKDNLFAYKIGFASGRHDFHTWRVVADPAAYGELLHRKELTPDPTHLTGRFPAYR